MTEERQEYVTVARRWSTDAQGRDCYQQESFENDDTWATIVGPSSDGGAIVFSHFVEFYASELRMIADRLGSKRAKSPLDRIQDVLDKEGEWSGAAMDAITAILDEAR